MLKKLFDEKLWKFLLVGVVNTLVGTGIMFALYNLLHVSYWLSSAANYVCGGLVSYFLNRRFTFRSANNVPVAMMKVAAYYAVFTPLSTLLEHYLADTLGWNEYPAARLNIDETSPDEAHRFANSIFLPRILLFRDLIGDEYEATAHLFSGPEYLIWQLTGNAVTILPESRYETAYWNAQVLEGFGIMTGKMPGFVELGHNCGTLLDNAQELLGLPAVPVIGVGPDFIAALIGTDTTEPGHICDRAGSSEGINMCVDKEIRAEGIRTLPGVKAGLWNISVLIPDSAALPEDVRLQKVTDAVQLLKKLAEENGINFPTIITTTGGQAKDEAYFEKKRAALAELGLELQIGTCVDAELEGDDKVAWENICHCRA